MMSRDRSNQGRSIRGIAAAMAEAEQEAVQLDEKKTAEEKDLPAEDSTPKKDESVEIEEEKEETVGPVDGEGANEGEAGQEISGDDARDAGETQLPGSEVAPPILTEPVKDELSEGKDMTEGEGETEAKTEAEPQPEPQAEEMENTTEAEETTKTKSTEKLTLDPKDGAMASHDELFFEGEEAEGPIVSVGAPLSRTVSTVHVEDQDVTLEVPTLRPGTPERDEEEREEEKAEEFEEEEEVEEEVFVVNRDELIGMYQEALVERDRLSIANNQLQHKLAEYFKRKKSDERQEVEKSVTDQEQRYVKCLGALEEHQMELDHIRTTYRSFLAEMKEKQQEKQEKLDEAITDYTEFKTQVSLAAVNSRSGKQMNPKDIGQYQAMESKKELEVTQVRLENIRLKHKLRKKEAQLKQKEELAEGLHLIDFEQLKIENTTYSEKIEERNEDLMKLRKKITSTVQVLTHLKEKLQFVQAENAEKRKELEKVDAVLAKKRDNLTHTKQARDALRYENVRLRQKCGLLGQESLLRDYEERKDETDKLQSRVNDLKLRYTQLTMDSEGIRRKIEHARQVPTF